VLLVGVQVEPLVVPVPGHAQLVGLLQDETGDPGSLETSPNGQPGWPRANHDRMARDGIRRSGHSGMIQGAKRSQIGQAGIRRYVFGKRLAKNFLAY
jgi:hypothetical protein